MSWGETIRLVSVLAADPSSHVAAALAGWDYPMSREAMLLADLFDLQHTSKAKRRPPPYPRPWRQSGKRQIGNRAGRSVEEITRILYAHGHDTTS